MKDNTDCEIIRDLLPIYVDHLTSDASNHLISEHLETCTECRIFFDELNKNINTDVPATKKEVNYLKKLKRKNIIIAISCVIFCFAVFIAAGYIHNYYHGIVSTPVPVDEVEFLAASVNEDGTVMCKVAATSDYEVGCSAVKRDGNIYYITFYSTRRPNKRNDGNKYALILETNIGNSPEGNFPASKIYYKADNDLRLLWERN